ncbi:hypothetical protein H2O64_20625 [Kordia sp. YSTF-M3]|uniref:Uncharacterized protein n=1 Tax=Kordia aestuariivivens TaxID=2759037 RepID=A0ABR7QEV0_9FLAO|nr:hypothetical protein [Kordia aestuariivivens]MBC8757090.1 hypothetical protein [Kordia aestuariivivens]
MKKILFPLLLLLCVFSCQKEGSLFEEEAIQSKPITLKSFETTSNYSEREILEINMRWTAYIAGSVLRDNLDAKLEIAALLQNGNRVIRLNQLLENNTAFADAFRNQTNFYFIEGRPSHDKTRPNPPPQGINGGGHSSLTGLFISYILNQQCIELYFPKSMNYTGNYTITTTGHSMNPLENFNDGIIRYYDPLLGTTTGSEGDNVYSTTHNVIVTNAYVNNYDNIIIARPYRNFDEPINDTNCSYTQYNDIQDFKDFLDY